MKQPEPGTCLPTSLAILSGRPYEEIIALMGRYTKPPRTFKSGWNEIELCYVAEQLGIHLMPFLQEACSYYYTDEFEKVYEKYDGILMGVTSDPVDECPPGHAVAKKDGYIVDPTWGTRSDPYGTPYTRLSSRVFFAWMNKP